MEIKTLGSLEEANYVKATLYGLPSSGKTRSIRTLPDRSNWLVITAEKGLMTISDLQDQPVVEVKNWKDVTDVYGFLSKSQDANKYRGAIFDTISEMTYLGIEKIRTDDRIEKFGFDQFGTILTRLQRLVRAFRDIPKDIIMLAQPKEKEEQVTNRSVFRPALIGSMNDEYPAHFDFMLYARYDDTGAYWVTKPQRNLRIKDRTGLLPERMQPDWQHVFTAHELKKQWNTLEEAKRKEIYQDFLKSATVNL